MKTGRGKRERHRPIGIFDSGLGGLTVVREIRRKLPAEKIVYFGDIARLPYGIKSKEQIIRYSIQNVRFLLKKRVKAIVVACNSSASAAYGLLKKNFKIPIIDVIEPVIEAALAEKDIRRVGVIATPSTISSGVYKQRLKKRLPSLTVVQRACPLFVPLVEEGWVKGKVVEEVIANYLHDLRQQKPEILILGCTHYPLLRRVIEGYMGKGVRLVDSAIPTAEKLTSLLRQKGLLYPSSREGSLEIYVSDLPRNFVKIGERFLGEELRQVKVVRVA